MASGERRMAIIASKGTLDMAYPPFILASAGAAMGMQVSIFFTFYGLSLLLKELDVKVSPLGNPAMPMKMPFGPKGFQAISWPIPNLVLAGVPGAETVATALMKQTFKNKGVATIEELRASCIDLGVKLIACEMTRNVFGFEPEQFVAGTQAGGAATFLEFAADADIQLFI